MTRAWDGGWSDAFKSRWVTVWCRAVPELGGLRRANGKLRSSKSPQNLNLIQNACGCSLLPWIKVLISLRKAEKWIFKILLRIRSVREKDIALFQSSKFVLLRGGAVSDDETVSGGNF